MSGKLIAHRNYLWGVLPEAFATLIRLSENLMSPRIWSIHGESPSDLIDLGGICAINGRLAVIDRGSGNISVSRYPDDATSFVKAEETIDLSFIKSPLGLASRGSDVFVSSETGDGVFVLKNFGQSAMRLPELPTPGLLADIAVSDKEVIVVSLNNNRSYILNLDAPTSGWDEIDQDPLCSPLLCTTRGDERFILARYKGTYTITGPGGWNTIVNGIDEPMGFTVLGEFCFILCRENDRWHVIRISRRTNEMTQRQIFPITITE